MWDYKALAKRMVEVASGGAHLQINCDLDEYFGLATEFDEMGLGSSERHGAIMYHVDGSPGIIIVPKDNELAMDAAVRMRDEEVSIANGTFVPYMSTAEF